MALNFSEDPHRRYNILTGEWILVSPHRTKLQHRSGMWAAAKVILGGVAGLAIGQLLLWWLPPPYRSDPLNLAERLPSQVDFLAPKGLRVETVLIRDVQLPDVIRTAITETKKREQEVLKQQAELERFATEQDQKVKKAESELRAARLEARRWGKIISDKLFGIEDQTELVRVMDSLGFKKATL